MATCRRHRNALKHPLPVSAHEYMFALAISNLTHACGSSSPLSPLQLDCWLKGTASAHHEKEDRNKTDIMNFTSCLLAISVSLLVVLQSNGCGARPVVPVSEIEPIKTLGGGQLRNRMY
ncbi:hypothetical protein PGT21_025015 [Puccinia graminis f. sp. tritici]|uniref:Uncharacterized protein n=1 Tax=Puccinia graminis f. sp. tritici TaxID=56615 RepID=A0A5B0MFV0_PUCGR|nr:hypothetical protein PGT21_025015 [Puccinia graminis f. sp. tritici]